MTKEEFKLELKNPKNIYCLVSIDSEMVDLYVNRFKNAINADIISYGKIKPSGRLFKKKTLNVLYQPKLDESLFERPEYIFIYTDTIDKRSSVYKKYKDRFIELNNDYTQYIMNNTNWSEQASRKFAQANNNDFGLIKNNLTIYKDSDNTYNRFNNYSSDIYGWVDAFLKKEPLPRINESPISVMALLSTNSQNVLKIKQHDTVGMNPYIIKVNEPITKLNTEKELIQIINDCFYLDCQIKKGLIDINDVLGYLITRRYKNGTSD